MNSTPKVFILKNGMVINHIYTPCSDLFKIELVIRAGTLKEKPEEIGFAHFIEHLMSFYPSKVPKEDQERLGTEGWPDSIQNQKILNEKGIQLNAWTADNTCGYYLYGLSKYKELMLQLMLTNYTHPYVDKKVIKEEKNAVISELHAIINDVWYYLEQMIEYVEYKGTNIEKTVEYEKDNVQKNIKLNNIDNVMDFRNRYYKPEYTSLTILSNDENIKDLINSIEEIYFPECKTIEQVHPRQYSEKLTNNSFGGWFWKNTKKVNFNDIAQLDKYKIFFIEAETDTVKVELHFPIKFDFFDDRKYALSMIDMMMSDGLGSRLYYALRTKLGAVYHVFSGSSLDPLDSKYSTYVIETETSQKKIKQVIDFILVELEILLKDDNFVTNEEWSQYEDSVSLRKNLNSCSMGFDKHFEFYKEYLIWGKKMKTIEQELKQQQKIIKDHKLIKNVAKEIFNPEEMKIFYSTNEQVLLTDNNKDITLEFKYSDFDKL